MIKQKLFKLSIFGPKQDKEYSKKNLDILFNEGYRIVMATPILEGRSCYTYTESILYVLEKEISNIGED